MELKFRVFAHISRTVHDVFEAVAGPEQLSHYFTTGGAKGRLEEGATVTWDFADFPGALWIGEHDPHVAGREERQIGRRAEEKREAQHVAIKRQRLGHIRKGERDLTYRFQFARFSCHFRWPQVAPSPLAPG